MMIAVTVHLTAIIAPASLSVAVRLLAMGSRMLACAAALWLLLALPGFLSERGSLLAEGGTPGQATLRAAR